jgi:hypothetical protein
VTTAFYQPSGASELLPRYAFLEGLLAGARVLEVGAAAATGGRGASFLRSRGAPSVLSLDSDPAAVAAVQKELASDPALRFRRADRGPGRRGLRPHPRRRRRAAGARALHARSPGAALSKDGHLRWGCATCRGRAWRRSPATSPAKGRRPGASWPRRCRRASGGGGRDADGVRRLPARAGRGRDLEAAVDATLQAPRTAPTPWPSPAPGRRGRWGRRPSSPCRRRRCPSRRRGAPSSPRGWSCCARSWTRRAPRRGRRRRARPRCASATWSRR